LRIHLAYTLEHGGARHTLSEKPETR